jgi:hypothetical protein
VELLGEERAVAGVTFSDLVSLIPELIAAYGVVLGAVVLMTGWQAFNDRPPRRKRRGAVVPPEGTIELVPGGARS